MEETSKQLPNFSVGIDLLGHPTSSTNEAEKNPQAMGFANLYKSRLRQILAARISLGTKKGTNWSLTTFKGKISVSIVVF